MEGSRIRLDGLVELGRIKPIGRLKVEGDMDVGSLRVGENIYFERRGLVGIKRELFEMRNMDVRVEGEMELKGVRCDRLESGLMEVMGELRVRGVMDVGSIRLKGGSIGEGRDFINIKLGNEYVSNVGMRIEAGRKVGIEIESEGIAIKTGGVMEVGGIIIGGESKIEKLGGEDLLGGLMVGRGRDGRIRFEGSVDLEDILGRLVAVLQKKNNMN